MKIKIKTREITKTTVHGTGQLVYVDFYIDGKKKTPEFFGDKTITKEFGGGYGGRYYYSCDYGEFATLTEAKKALELGIEAGLLTFKETQNEPK